MQPDERGAFFKLFAFLATKEGNRKLQVMQKKIAKRFMSKDVKVFLFRDEARLVQVVCEHLINLDPEYKHPMTPLIESGLEKIVPHLLKESK
jgi:hypothetical protein